MAELMTNMGIKMSETENRVNQTQEFKDWLISMLKYGPVKIKFEKTDGSIRKMNCTLNEDMVVYPEKKTERTREPNPDVCPVYDLDKKEWRSFRYDTVKEVRFDL